MSNQNAYQKELTSLLKKSENPKKNTQERWKKFLIVTQEAAIKINTVGMKNKNYKTEDGKIKKLSDKQKQLRIKVNNTDNGDTEKCEQLRRERNKKMAEIYSELRKQETLLEPKLEKMENNKNSVSVL